MTRRVVETAAINRDREHLAIITVYEQGINKQAIKRDNPLSKRHGVLYPCGEGYEYK